MHSTVPQKMTACDFLAPPFFTGKMFFDVTKITDPPSDERYNPNVRIRTAGSTNRRLESVIRSTSLSPYSGIFCV